MVKKTGGRSILIIEFSKDINKLSKKTHKTNYALIIDFVCKYVDQKILHDPGCEVGIILAGCPRNARRERIINGVFLMEAVQKVNLKLYQSILLGGIPRIDEAGDVDFERALLVALKCFPKNTNDVSDTEDDIIPRLQLNAQERNEELGELTEEDWMNIANIEEKKKNQIIFITYGSTDAHFIPEELHNHLKDRNIGCTIIGLLFKKDLFFDSIEEIEKYRLENISPQIYNQTQWNELALMCNGSIYTYDEALEKIKEPKILKQERKRCVCKIHLTIPFFVRLGVRIYPYTNVKQLPRLTLASKLVHKTTTKTDVMYKKEFHPDRKKRNRRHNNIKPTFYFDDDLYFDKASNVHICSKYLGDSVDLLKRKRSARDAELSENSKKKVEKENNSNDDDNDKKEKPENSPEPNEERSNEISEYYRYAKIPSILTEQIKKKLKEHPSNLTPDLRCFCVCKISEIQTKYVVGNTYFVVGSNKGAAKIIQYLVNVLKEQNSFLLALYKSKPNSRVYVVGLLPMIEKFHFFNLIFFASNEYIYYFNWKSEMKENQDQAKKEKLRSVLESLMDTMEATHLYKETNEIMSEIFKEEGCIKKTYDFISQEFFEMPKNSFLLTKDIYNSLTHLFHFLLIEKYKISCKINKQEGTGFSTVVDKFVCPQIEVKDIETLLVNKKLLESKKEEMESLKLKIQSDILGFKKEISDEPEKKNINTQGKTGKCFITQDLINTALGIQAEEDDTEIKNWFKTSKHPGRIKILRDHKIYLIKKKELWMHREKENTNESTSKSVLRMLSEKIKRSLRWY